MIRSQRPSLVVGPWLLANRCGPMLDLVSSGTARGRHTTEVGGCCTNDRRPTRVFPFCQRPRTNDGLSLLTNLAKDPRRLGVVARVERKEAGPEEQNVSRPCAMRANPRKRRRGRSAVLARTTVSAPQRVHPEKMGQPGDKKADPTLLTKSCVNGASYIAPPKARKFKLIW